MGNGLTAPGSAKGTWRSASMLLGLLSLVGPARAADTPASRRPPNVVLIAVDTLRGDHLGCYGYSRATTPNIDKLARAGLLFENCTSPASWTIPSFMSLWTGVYPHVHGCTDMTSVLPPSLPTLAERMKQKGYACSAVVSNPLMNAKFGFGRGFDHYDDYSVFLDAEMKLLSVDSGRPSAGVSELVTSPLVTREAVALLRKARKAGKPFFLFVHYFDPHDSYVPPAPFDRQFDATYDGPVSGKDLPALRNRPPAGRDLEHLVALYDGEVAHTDQQVGRLLDEVDRDGGAGDTLTVLLSDHGEAFGEHGTLLHGDHVYREVAAVPMVWRWPGVLPAGKREAAPVSVMDLAPTLRDLLQLDGMGHMQATSLRAALEGKPLPADRAVFCDHANRQSFGGKPIGLVKAAVARGGLRLHGQFVGSPSEQGAKFQLFDLAADPGERKDLYGPGRREAAELCDLLTRQWAESVARRAEYQDRGVARRVELDEKERQRLKGLGYVGDGATK